MNFSQFVGADYKTTSVNVAAEECINFFVERVESQTAQSPYPACLLPAPGLAVFVSGLDGPIRAMLAQDGRVYCVAGSKVYEIDGDGTVSALGDVAEDGNPASLAANGHGGHQLAIVSAGLFYIYDTISGAFGAVATAPPNLVTVDFCDGYFVVTQATTSSFFLSALFDGLTWDLTDVGQVSSSSDTLQAVRVIQRTLWVLGSLRTEPWVNTGATFPFQPIAGSLIEYGLAAVWSLAEADGSIFLVGQDERGAAMVLQTAGYGFKRISTQAQERIVSALPDLAAIRSYTYQRLGHTFLVVCPSSGPALVYDLATGLWHQRGRWNAGTASYEPLPQWCHVYGHGKHLVGDRTTGTIYEESEAFGTYAGEPIRRVRTAPHVNERQQWIFGSQVTLGVETGLSSPVTGERYRAAVGLLSPHHYWPLDDLTTAVRDLGLTPQPGTVVNFPARRVPSGTGGSGMGFDGVDDSVTLASVTPSTTTFSVGFWVRMPAAAASANVVILAGAAGNLYLSLSPSPTTFAVVAWQTVSGYCTPANPQLTFPTDGSWHQVVVSVAAGAGTAYVDGAGKAMSSGTDTTIDAFTPAVIASGLTVPLALSDVAYWPGVALTAAQVAALYLAGTPEAEMPTIDLSFSRDGGHTFSTPVSASLGAGGEYAKLVKWTRTPGRFQDLVLRAVTTAASPVRINSCDLRLEGGTGQR